MDKQRNQRIDIMRAIGLILIVLAHTISTNNTIFQIRTFDVPMMVVISGMSFILSSPQKLDLKKYYQKRVSRLILPTWIFLTLFFGISLVFHLGSDEPYLFTNKVLNSYLLMNNSSIGYMWIIRVFILVSLTAPLLIWLERKLNSNIKFTIFLSLTFILYQILLNHFGTISNNHIKPFINNYLFYVIPYSILFGYGMIIHKSSYKLKLIMAPILTSILIITILIEHNGHLEFTPQNFKYPPNSYFVIWGLLMSLIIEVVLQTINLKGLTEKLIMFLSSNSLWIYFWHIVIIYTLKPLNLSKSNGYLFTIVLSLSIVITILHVYFFSWLLTKTQYSKKLNKLISVTFL